MYPLRSRRHRDSCYTHVPYMLSCYAFSRPATRNYTFCGSLTRCFSLANNALPAKITNLENEKMRLREELKERVQDVSAKVEDNLVDKYCYLEYTQILKRKRITALKVSYIQYCRQNARRCMRHTREGRRNMHGGQSAPASQTQSFSYSYGNLFRSCRDLVLKRTVPDTPIGHCCRIANRLLGLFTSRTQRSQTGARPYEIFSTLLRMRTPFKL